MVAGRFARMCCVMGLAAAVTALSGCDRSKPSDARSEPRKIFLIVVDSLRYDHLNAFGYRRETAPYIAQLVEESVVFDLAISPSNYTGVSVPSYFTGKPLSQIFAQHPDPVWIPDEEQTLAELLSNAGFDTYLWGSNLHLSLKGFDQGFSHFFNGHLQNPMTSLVSIEGLIREAEQSYTDTGAREFHYVHTMDVHFPYHPPHPYERMMGGPMMSEYRWGPASTGMPRDHFGVLVWSNLPYYAQNHHVGEEDIEYLKGLYDGTIRYTDAYLQELLDSLGYDPDLDMLILTADHGEQLFSHGWAAHTALLLMQEIHVPLIVRAPGYAPRRVPGPVSLMDLYPTLCDLLGLDKPEGLTGVSLASALNGDSEGSEAAYSESWHRRGAAASLVTRDHMYNFQGNQSVMYPWRLWPMSMELYNIGSDPDCMNDLLLNDIEAARPFHDELLTRFPQWASYDWDKLHAPEDGLKFGEDEFGDWRVRHPFEGETVLDELTRSVEVDLHAARPELLATASISEPDNPYSLYFKYKVERGYARFELVDADTGEPIWEYDVVKKSPAFLTVHVRVDIPAERVEFRAIAREGGTEIFGSLETRERGYTFVGDLLLRRLYVPEITPVATGTARKPETDSEADVLSDTEKDALEAIGYIQ